MARRKPLVTQHLENVSRDALEKYQHIIKDHIRNRQGIYALYRRGKLYYVGLAGNLRNRLQTHLRDRHGHSWDQFSVYLTIGDEHMRELEALILRIVRPKGNKVKGKFIRSENLFREVRRHFKEAHREEMESLFPRKRSLDEDEEDVRKTKSRATGRRPMLIPYIHGAITIRVRYKGKNYKARIRKDGTISFRGRIYNSPSLAGKAVAKHAINGWQFWKYERSPGDWVPLENLRK